ncbi:MAG: hypothetical protein II304_07880 [Bacteroidales bacterium]|nr:hypothetical protein [Bacteroidales bacterium]
MTERERLIELLNKKQDAGLVYNISLDSKHIETKEISNNELADYLIENGVTIKACETCEYIRTHKMRGTGIELIGKSLKYCPECGKKIK